MLLFLDKEDKIMNSDQVNDIISAEIPDQHKYPRLYNIIKQCMIHGPCGEQNPNSPCMNEYKDKCTKYFPKEFNNETNFNVNGYPKYRPRNDTGK